MERHNFKWNINEIIRLEREYDLLKLDVSTIAKLHKRSELAIAYKLQHEDIISNYKDARGFVSQKLDSNFDNSSKDILSDSDSDSDYGSNCDSDCDSDYGSDCDSDCDSNSSTENNKNNKNKNVTQRVKNLEDVVSNMDGMLTKIYKLVTSNSSNLTMGYDN